MAQVIIKTIDHWDDVKRATSGAMLLKALMAAGQALEGYAKINVINTFSKRSTGGAGLAGSIQTVKGEGCTETHAEVDVGPTVIYGRIQELGGIIKPVLAKILSWIDPDSGERIFANSVQLPPRPYLRPAADEHMDEIAEAFNYQIQKQIEEACK